MCFYYGGFRKWMDFVYIYLADVYPKIFMNCNILLQIQNVRMLKELKRISTWYLLLFIFLFYFCWDFSPRFSGRARWTNQIHMSVGSWGLECVSSWSEWLGREYGRAAGRSNFQAKRELQGAVIGRFCHGYGGETEENSSERFIPTNRGRFLW